MNTLNNYQIHKYKITKYKTHPTENVNQHSMDTEEIITTNSRYIYFTYADNTHDTLIKYI